MRPIDADVVFAKLNKICVTDDVYGMGVAEGIAKAMSAILSTSTIEAEPVRHGRWERTTDGAARCTACKRKMNPSQYGYAFCGLCGAKMDLGGMTNDEG